MIISDKDLYEAKRRQKASEDTAEGLACCAWILGLFCFLSLLSLTWAFGELGITLLFGVLFRICLHYRAKYVSRAVQQKHKMTLLADELDAQKKHESEALAHQRGEATRLQQEAAELLQQQWDERQRSIAELAREQEREKRTQLDEQQKERLRLEQIETTALSRRIEAEQRAKDQEARERAARTRRLVQIGDTVTIVNELTGETRICTVRQYVGWLLGDPEPDDTMVWHNSKLGLAILSRIVGDTFLHSGQLYLISSIDKQSKIIRDKPNPHHMTGTKPENSLHHKNVRQIDIESYKSVAPRDATSRSDDNLDGSKYLGYMSREGGAFGSLPEYDDMSDESSP